VNNIFWLLFIVVLPLVLAYLQFRRGSFGKTADPEERPTDSPGNMDTKSSGWVSRLKLITLPVLGTALLCVGVVIWMRPDLVPPELATQLREIGDGPQTPYYLLGGVVGVAALLIVTFGSRPDTQQAISDIEHPEEITKTPTRFLTGQHLDDAVETLADPEHDIEDDQEPIDEHLQDVVVESLVTYLGWSRSRSVESVEQGTWTPKPEVAAFIGGVDAPDMPLWWRLRDWLSADPAHHRRVQRTLLELDRVTRRREP
jgi:hypothetical protein